MGVEGALRVARGGKSLSWCAGPGYPPSRGTRHGSYASRRRVTSNHPAHLKSVAAQGVMHMHIVVRVEHGELVCDLGIISGPPPEGHPFTGPDLMVFDQESIKTSVGTEIAWQGYLFTAEDARQGADGALFRVTITRTGSEMWFYLLYPAHWEESAWGKGRSFLVGKRVP